MKRPRLISFFLIFLLGTTLKAQGLQIIQQQQMDFGNLIVEPMGGSITLTPGSQLVPGPDRRVRGFQNASPKGAFFRITGAPGRRITVELEPLTPAFTSPSPRLRIATFQTNLPSPLCQLNDQGYLDVYLGATLDVSAGNQSGLFSQHTARIIVRDREASRRSNDPSSITAPCPIRAFVRAPLTLERRRDLSFGDILLRPEGGQLCLEPGGNYFWKGPRSQDILRAKPHTAQFLVGGSTDAQIGIRIPMGSVLLKNHAGDSVTLSRFTTDVERTVRLPDSGPLSFEIGATMEIAPNQAPGAYQGTFTVSVNYL